MSQHEHRAEIGTVNDPVVIEDALKAMWDKVRAAGELIDELKKSKSLLADRVSVLEKEVSSLRSGLASREQELKRLQVDHNQLMNTRSNNAFSQEEKEILMNRIRDLITKINSHL